MVRRRVPAAEVEDLAQTILCDALAASNVPSNPEELRRFVAGIARHKVADFHRRARWVPLESAPEPAAEPAPVEARALLTSIAESASASAREKETLGWLVREHAGEPLSTIAADAGLPWPAVRQRVSRLRRALRAQWAQALALLVVAGACGVLAERSRADRSAIVADPLGDPVARTASLARGTWHIDRVAFASGTFDTAAATVEAKLVTVEVAGRRVEVVSAMHKSALSITSASTRADGSVAIDLRDDAGRTVHAIATIDGDRMRLELTGGSLRGTAQLTRR
jgi:DNA-directed RNA polymerase specialized sigma24 family protein